MANNEAMTTWVAALRSGEFEQTVGILYNPADNGYCCLGVACVVAYRAGVIDALPWDLPAEDERHCKFMWPDAVQEWLGVDRWLGIGSDERGRPICAHGANDAGWSFNQIADAIESTYLNERTTV